MPRRSSEPCTLTHRSTVTPCAEGRPPTQHAQFCLACPSTYQLEGGLSVALPAGLQRAVLHHVVAQITGDEKGNYTGFSGYTSIPGRGWWYSENACQEVEKRVEWVMVHAKIDRVAVASLARYLQWAWLQDLVFVTLDGANVQPTST